MENIPYDQLYDSHHLAIQYYVRCILQDRTEAAIITQTVFHQLFRPILPAMAVEAWLCQLYQEAGLQAMEALYGKEQRALMYAAHETQLAYYQIAARVLRELHLRPEEYPQKYSIKLPYTTR
jgi:hypothetical protein